MRTMNENEWFREEIKVKIDRVSLLTIVGDLELTLRHPDLPARTREMTKTIGSVFALRLIQDGIILPPQVIESWEETFGICLDEAFKTVDLESILEV